MKTTILFLLISLTSLPALAYKAHEWGTFTSLVGSNGKTQTGMYHEDEKLPEFVYGFGKTQPLVLFPAPPPEFPPLDDCTFNFKTCFNPAVFNNNFVSQKMETPVIYFYDGQANQVIDVDVTFPEGIITETFPAPVTSFPKNQENLVIANGDAQFSVQLLGPNTSLLPPEVEVDNIYGHARETDSMMLRTSGDIEKFIFYRGLGRFNPRPQVYSSQGNLSVSGRLNEAPKSAFLVYVDQNLETFMLPILSPENRPSQHEVMGQNYNLLFSESLIEGLKVGDVENVKRGSEINSTLVSALVKEGLYQKEALAMVKTWEHGYFKVPGLRLLYTLPRDEVDSILPLEFTPKAEEVERVFIARLEVMLESEELELVQNVINQKSRFDYNSIGRFAEPKLRRAKEVYLDEGTPDKIELYEFHLEKLFDALINESMLAETAPVTVN